AARTCSTLAGVACLSITTSMAAPFVGKSSAMPRLHNNIQLGQTPRLPGGDSCCPRVLPNCFSILRRDDPEDVMGEEQGADTTPAPEEAAMALWRVDGATDLGPPASSPPPASPPQVERIVEALLFVGGAPLTATRACETVRGLTEEQFLQAIDGLNREYRRQGRPCAIQVRNRRYVMALRPRFRDVVDRIQVRP